MKYPALLSFEEIIPQIDQIDTIIDVRSPAEFAADHIPGAINCPVLDDLERIRIGTMYKQKGSFEAKKAGAVFVARNCSRHIEELFQDKPREWRPMIYCWRGGNRSAAMSHILAKIGWPAIQLDGGYKAYRRHVSLALSELPSRLTFNVVCGTTGSGKSRLLQVLASEGAQVLDLEKLAAHRGSVLGNLLNEPQPLQKMFESRIWELLRHYNPGQVVFIESESKKVGNLRVPDTLMEQMRASPCISLTLSRSDRVRLLIQDYAHFVTDPALLNIQLECLVTLHGREKIARWQAMALSGQTEILVTQLLEEHYDPAYTRSIERNFGLFSQAARLELADISDAAFLAAALALKKSPAPAQ